MAIHPFNIQLDEDQYFYFIDKFNKRINSLPPTEREFLQEHVDSLINCWREIYRIEDIKPVIDRWDDVSEEIRNQVKTLMGVL